MDQRRPVASNRLALASSQGRVHVAAYHAPSGRVIVFGGRAGAGSNHLLDDTAAWDGTTWATVVPAPASPVVALGACSAGEALAGYGGGSIVPNEPTGAAMEIDFFEPLSGPCHLHIDVVITLLGINNQPLKMTNNPAKQALDADLTWDAGGEAVVFDAPGICVFGQVNARIQAGTTEFQYPFAGYTPCPDGPTPPPSLKSWVVNTGLRP